jgi:N-acetylglucosamine kinase-like BadF-type ATPase
MILVVDSGSTKTDWAVINGLDHTIYPSIGINPSSDTAFISLSEHNAELANLASKIEKIHYYGAGVIDYTSKSRIETWLLNSFPNTIKINIQSDLLGACKALAGDKKGIISILGTGCNSCTYNGSEITDNIPSLGYKISNEGAGTDIGRTILKAYFYRQMPLDVKVDFESKYDLDKSSVIRSLYQESGPTAYLAKFAHFINETNNLEWRRALLSPLFQSFIDIRIKSYFDYLSYELYFVGSIAYFCEDILKEVLENNNLHMTLILQKPIQGLIKYHTNNRT